MLNKKIAIVGGGIAGISVSIELLKRNIPHTLIESKRFIGGRFYSFFEKSIGFEIENGQHLFSTAYHNFFEILKYLDTYKYLHFPHKLSIPFFDLLGEKSKLEAFFVDNKMGLFLGLLKFPIIPLKSKFNIIKLLFRLNNFRLDKTPQDNTRDFLLSERQDSSAMKYFWEPIGISVFNNHLKNIPTNLFINTIQLAFLKTKSNFVFSTVGSSQLVNPYVQIANKSKNVQLMLSLSVKSIIKENDKFILVADNNQRMEFDVVFLCIPPNYLKKIIPTEWLSLDYFTFLNNLKFNPIVSIYSTFKTKIMDEFFAYFLDSPFHWIFNRNKMLNDNSNQYLYSFTTSNAVELVDKTNQEIMNLLETELEKHFKTYSKNNLINFKVIKDKFATINLDFEFNKKRPRQLSPINGLFLAGDWTDTKLPATLESAALSGKLAVQYMLNKTKNQ